MSATPNLASVIPSPQIRKWVYIAYGGAVLIVGAIQAAFAVDGTAQPDWLTRTLAVLAYLAVPVAGLAVANTPDKSTAIRSGATTVNITTSLDETDGIVGIVGPGGKIASSSPTSYKPDPPAGA